MLITVDTSKLVSPRMLNRYAKADADVLRSIRATLDAPGIELPDPIKCKKPQ
jgi:hypothetical protein